jgi:hypothetical protein
MKQAQTMMNFQVFIVASLTVVGQLSSIQESFLTQERSKCYTHLAAPDTVKRIASAAQEIGMRSIPALWRNCACGLLSQQFPLRRVS